MNSSLSLKDITKKCWFGHIDLSPTVQDLQQEYWRRVRRWRDHHDVWLVGIQAWIFLNQGLTAMKLVSTDSPTSWKPAPLHFQSLDNASLTTNAYRACGYAFYLPPDPQRAVWIRKWLRKWSRAFEEGLVTHILSFL